MTEFRKDKETIQLMGKCVDFVCELIDYIAEYPDDDYMTMECLCRKLVKYDLIDKKDGYYLVDKGIKVVEPQTDGYMTAEQAEDYRKMLDEAEHKVYGNIEDEPQTERLEQFRVGLEYHTDTTHFGKTKGESVTTNKIEDEPQTDCRRCKHYATDKCKECFGHELFTDSGYATDCSWQKGE